MTSNANRGMFRALALLFGLAFVGGCASREHTNPFDPDNEETNGSPNLLVATAGDERVTLEWDLEEFQDLRLVRVRRRSIGFVVDTNGLTVRAANRVPLREIDAAVREKGAWILARLAEQRERAAHAAASRVVWRDGANLYLSPGALSLAGYVEPDPDLPRSPDLYGPEMNPSRKYPGPGMTPSGRIAATELPSSSVLMLWSP